MLALTRKKGSSIVIGNDIEITVLGIQGDQVKLGIVAPKNISVHRKEIFLQIQKENAEAALNSNIDLKKLFWYNLLTKK